VKHGGLRDDMNTYYYIMDQQSPNQNLKNHVADKLEQSNNLFQRYQERHDELMGANA
jgi:hypothetical protein